MKKLSSTMVAAATSAGMLIGVGAATAQIPDPVPSECPAGQHFESVDGTFQCVDDAANPDPGEPSNDGIPPGIEDTETCPDGSPRDMSKIDPATGAFGACSTSDDSGPTPEPDDPEPDEDAPENDGIPPGVDDTATCPDGSPRDMSKIDPATGVYGYCPTSDDETPGDDDAPGDNDAPGDEQPGNDEKPGEKKPGDKPNDPKKDGKKTETKSNGLAVTGVQATALGGAALALLVGGVAATRLARKNSKDS